MFVRVSKKAEDWYRPWFQTAAFQDESNTTVDTKTREQRYHELRGISYTSRRMLEAVYVIAFNRYPADDMPDTELIQAILNAEFPPSAPEVFP